MYHFAKLQSNSLLRLNMWTMNMEWKVHQSRLPIRKK
ncbi:unnamed protein product [Schistosoma margrebowiei]|uniref:Uncharacterized protein n=1 Tax=Schistosoma margrebowiei TaxID=48269 RepID=A0A3P8BHP1_9TREM|nr:unnamed protein product [Schistosoma margrebowiei]